MSKQVTAAENPTFVEPERRDEIIRSATSGGLPATLTRFGGGGWTTCPARFLSCDTQERHIWIEQSAQEYRCHPPPFRAGEPLGVSFRHHRTKCTFSSVVVGAVASHSQSGADAFKAVIHWPEHLQEMQRRVYRRVNPPPGRRIDVRYWLAGRSGPLADARGTDGPAAGIELIEELTQPTSGRVLAGRLLDLSAGGLRVSISELWIEWARGARVICEFTPLPGAPAIRLEARLQHIEPAINGQRSIGFQFVGLDTSMAGQRLLAHLASIVTAFQRVSRRPSRPHLPAGARSP